MYRLKKCLQLLLVSRRGYIWIQSWQKKGNISMIIPTPCLLPLYFSSTISFLIHGGKGRFYFPFLFVSSSQSHTLFKSVSKGSNGKIKSWTNHVLVESKGNLNINFFRMWQTIHNIWNLINLGCEVEGELHVILM